MVRLLFTSCPWKAYEGFTFVPLSSSGTLRYREMRYLPEINLFWWQKESCLQGSKHFFLRSEGTPQVVMVCSSDFSLKVSAEAAIITNKGDYSFTEFNL